MSGTGLAGRDGTRRRGTRDGTGPSNKNKAGRDGTGQEDAGHGTGRDDFLVVPRSPGKHYTVRHNYQEQPLTIFVQFLLD